MKQLKRFYTYFCTDLRKSITILALLSFVAAVLELIGFAPLIKIFDLISTKEHFYSNEFVQCIISFFGLNTDKKIFLFFMSLALLLFSLKALFMFFHQYYTCRFLTQLRNKVGSLFMEKLLKAPYEFFLKKNSDDLVNTIDNTIRYVIMLYMSYVVQFFVYVVLLATLLILVLYKFLFPTIVSLCVMGILVYIQIRLFKKIIHYVSNQTTEANTKNIYIIQKIIHAIKEIKISNAGRHVFKCFENSSNLVSDTEQKGAYIQNVQVFFTEIVIFSGLFTFLLNLICLASFEKTIANLALLVAIFFRAAPALNRILGAYGSMKSYQGSLISLNNEYDNIPCSEEKDITNSEDMVTFSKIISLKNISFKYTNNKKPVLKEVSIDIKQGEFIGVAGGSGAGKTTLMNVILGMLQPTSGSYSIDDVCITNENVPLIRHLFGYTAQDPFIDSTSISNNIGFCEDELNMNYIKELMQKCLLDEFPIDYLIKENGKTLSGGQRQRIALARALYKNPKILILDEATSALDIYTEEKIMKFISSLKREMTIISVAHRLSSLKYCDKIIFLNAGKVVDFDTFKNLQANNKDFAKMVKLSQV